MAVRMSPPGRTKAKSMCVVVPPKSIPRVSSSGPSVSPGSSGWLMMAWARCVCVDAAGDHALPGRIDDARGLERAWRTERRDALALNPEIPLPDAGRRHDATTTDHEIEHDRLLTPRL